MDRSTGLANSPSGNMPRNTGRPNSEANTTSPNHRLNGCFHRLLLVLVMLFLILSAVCTIAWFVIDPEDPSFVLNSLSISNISLSDSRFTANYELEFYVNNTNKEANMDVDLVNVAVLYRKFVVSHRDFEEKSAYIQKMSLVKMKLVLDSESVCSVKDEFKDLSDDWSNKKIVDFNIEMVVRSKFEDGHWPSKNKLLNVRCVDLVVEFLSRKGVGKLMSAGKGCSLHAI